ncbi:hypothetical protein HPB48_016570 [Haemaphysalis longicornis]|uniref:Kinesin motor domain-containing protein n=1 Tax=Haemaphysalis longicornis TaxID=44386 RepID=A0A9J6GK80_HAELO|nr:hypothetical protein HPB48_016570 [Haemaphysalis longicornis]
MLQRRKSVLSEVKLTPAVFPFLPFVLCAAGKTWTMLGDSSSAQELGVVPCAVSWLFRLIEEHKQRTGARFSVRVSAVQVTGRSEHLRDLLAEQATGSESESRNWHFLFTLHVYQYRVDKSGRGGVAGGRSRLHLFDLGSCERGTKAGGPLSLSALGNVILALFNAQKRLPFRMQARAVLCEQPFKSNLRVSSLLLVF